jgi:DNA primase
VLQEHADKIAIPVRGERGLMGVERRSQLEIRVMQLPRGMDPDELLLAEGGPARWEELREGALPLVDHVIGVVAGKHDLNSAHGKSEAVGEMALYVREIGDPVQRAHYMQRVASVLRVPEDAVREAIGRATPQKRDGRKARDEGRATEQPVAQSPKSSNSLPTTVDMITSAEEHLVSLVLRYPQVTWMAGAPVPEDFMRLENRLIFETVARTAASESNKSTPVAEDIRAAARAELDEALLAHFDRIAAREEPELFRFALPYELETRLKRLRQHNDRMWLHQCQVMLQEAQETDDNDTIGKLLPLLTASFSRFRHYQPKPSTVFRDSRD